MDSLFGCGKIVKIERQNVTVLLEDGSQTHVIYTTPFIPAVGTTIVVRVIRSPDNVK
jgi:hypothetical protein